MKSALELRQLLVEALRSGKYEQGTLYLNQADKKFCCLGVACEIYIQAGGKLERKVSGRRFQDREVVMYADGAGAHARSSMPAAVQEAFGFRGALGQRRSGNPLCVMNDTGSTFAEIADIIERNDGGVFVDA